MKTLSLMVLLLALLSSCSLPKEAVLPQPSPPAVTVQPEPVIVAVPKVTPPALIAPGPVKEFFSCGDDTAKVFNSFGIEMLPFMRPVFFDIDNDGKEEMIVGSKDGLLRLYKNSYGPGASQWSLVEGYFEGINAGAFSAAAIGDLDGDGKAEVVLGTGGFSPDSGRIRIFRNTGTVSKPLWKMVDMPDMHVGNDAVPALLDIDHKGVPDIVAGNSAGTLTLFRNRSKQGRISFSKDHAYFRDMKFGIYAAPAAASESGRDIIIIGNATGKVVLLERLKNSNGQWQREVLKIRTPSFAVPAFIASETSGRRDLVVSDGNGELRYYKNSGVRDWDELKGHFGGRVLVGPAATPSITEINGRPHMVAGNINGELKLFESGPFSGQAPPWTERPGFFHGIKLSSFSKGVLTAWLGRPLLVTGQQDGKIRAFINQGTESKPLWKELEGFFNGITPLMHAVPVVFDIDGDGQWELIAGDEKGFIQGFRVKEVKDGMPLWSRIEKVFDEVKVERFSSPSFFKDRSGLYLFVGQQDGRIVVFSAKSLGREYPVFHQEGILKGVKVNDHSAPAAIEKGGLLELSVGDYNGNLKHFACRRSIN